MALFNPSVPLSYIIVFHEMRKSFMSPAHHGSRSYFGNFDASRTKFGHNEASRAPFATLFRGI